MIIKNNNLHFGGLSILFHWLTLVLVVAIFYIGYVMNSPGGYMWHKSLGITVLTLSILRIIWIHISPGPAYPDSMNRTEKRLAKCVQYFLYFCLIVMPLSGWIFSTAAGHPPNFFGLGTLPFPIGRSKEVASVVHNTHVALSTVFLVFIALHALAALKHHFINKDGVLMKMFGK